MVCATEEGLHRTIGVAALTIGLDVISDLLSKKATALRVQASNERSQLSRSLSSFFSRFDCVSSRSFSLLSSCVSAYAWVSASALLRSLFPDQDRPVIVAVIRVAGIRIKGTNIDVVWETFWGAVEANIAVIVVSITAFRSLLGMQDSQARQERQQREWYSYHQRQGLLRKKARGPYGTNIDKSLPDLPSVTMSGDQSVTFESGHSTQLSNNDPTVDEKDYPTPSSHSLDHVSLPIQTTSTNVSCILPVHYESLLRAS